MAGRNRPALALAILEKAQEAQAGGEKEDTGMARREAGNAFLKAMESGDGEMIAQAIQDIYQVTAD